MNPHKHGWTQGPLIFEPHGGFGRGISDTGTIVKVTNPRCKEPFPFGYISTAHPSPIFALEPITSHSENEMRALARLMAASPELYEALEALLEEAEDVFVCMADATGIDRHNLPAPFIQARAALSKAKAPAEGEG